MQFFIDFLASLGIIFGFGALFMGVVFGYVWVHEHRPLEHLKHVMHHKHRCELCGAELAHEYEQLDDGTVHIRERCDNCKEFFAEHHIDEHA